MQPADGLSINAVVLDFDAVMRQSSAIQSIREQLDVRREAFQQEFADIEERLRDMEREIGEARETLTQEELDTMRQELQEEVTAAQRTAQARRSALDAGFQVAIDRVNAALVEIVARIADERQVNFVLDRGAVIIANRELDITQLALDRLNAELPELDLVLPQPQ